MFNLRRKTIYLAILALLSGACGGSAASPSSTAETVDSALPSAAYSVPAAPTGSDLKITAYSDREVYRSVEELISESDLVVRVRALSASQIGGGAEQNYVTWAQPVEVIDVILGDKTPTNPVVLTTGDIHPDNPQIKQALVKEGEFFLPPMGFGALANNNEYILFLTYSNVSVETEYEGTPMWLTGAAQGAIRIDKGAAVLGSIGTESVQRVLQENGLGSEALDRFHLEVDPTLFKSTTATGVLEEIRAGSSAFLPSDSPLVNFDITLSVSEPGPYDRDGQLVRVDLSGGARNSQVYVALCLSNTSTVDDCDTENAVLASIGSDGKASFEIFVRNGPFGEGSITCDSKCAISAGSYTDLYSSAPIEFE